MAIKNQGRNVMFSVSVRSRNSQINNSIFVYRFLCHLVFLETDKSNEFSMKWLLLLALFILTIEFIFSFTLVSISD